ncbi:MAG: uracil-DNA glycosylase family protein [Pyrinomonadaceae bacterium]
MGEQKTLFSESAALLSPSETLDEVNADLLQRAKVFPQFAAKVFIFGEGAAGQPAAIVGESPGPPDIDSERPFMGPAGQMLDRILASIGLRRETCYLTNAVKMVCSGDEITPEVLSFLRLFYTASLMPLAPAS